MKKYLLLLSLAFIAVTAFGQTSIPNGNFESWDSVSYSCPQSYPYCSNPMDFYQSSILAVTQTTAAYHGNYALQIKTVVLSGDTIPGFITNVNPNSFLNGTISSWTGGMPYNQRPSGIRGYYKYNMAVDSALIGVIFSKAGSNIGTYHYTIGGIDTSNYTMFDFSFSPALTAIPDSVILIIFSSNMLDSHNKGMMVHHNNLPGSKLVIDSISFTGVSSQPTWMNGDFELWQQSPFIYKPANWNIQNADSSGIMRTTDAEHGNYALELKSYIFNSHHHASCLMSEVSNGYYNSSCGCLIGGYPFSNQVDTLAFYYKYTPGGTADSASIFYNFKINDTTFSGSLVSLPATIGTGYQYEEIPINLWQVPDSVMVEISPLTSGDTSLSSVGSDLKIDEIHFKSQPLHTSVFNYENNNSITIIRLSSRINKVRVYLYENQ